MKVSLNGIATAIAELKALQEVNRATAGRILRVSVRLTAQYVIRDHVDSTRHTPAYTGNLLSNWYIALGGKAIPYNEVPAYRDRKPLSGESLGYEPHNGFQDITWKQLADQKYRELSAKTYDITGGSFVRLGNNSPYWISGDGVVSGEGVTGKPFSVKLRPENRAAKTEADIEDFIQGMMPAVVTAVLSGQRRITYHSLTEAIE